MPAYRPHAQQSATMNTAREPLNFDITAELVRRADVPAPKGASWRDGADAWKVTIRQREYGNTVTVDYYTGVGLRAFAPQTLHDEEVWTRSVPVGPSAASVLSSLVLDVSTLADLPNDEGAALDELAETHGYSKPSEALRALRGLREAADKIAALVRNTGLTAADFADWASELDA